MKLRVNDKVVASAPVTIIVAPLHPIPNLPVGYVEVSRWTDGTGTTAIRCWPQDRESRMDNDRELAIADAFTPPDPFSRKA